MNILKIDGLSIYNRNASETQEIYNSLFIRKDYDLSINNNAPKIIDCGAHIGLATIFLKRKFPHAEITAIEANPETLRYLKKNLQKNNISDTKVIWGALSKASDGTIPLYIDSNREDPWSWDDSIIKDIWVDRPSRKNKQMVQVPTLHLSEFITDRIDLIKMDIEGAECEVIEEAEKKLDLVDSIIIEIHPTPKTPLSNLQKIRSILQNHNFTLEQYPVDWTLFIKAIKT